MRFVSILCVLFALRFFLTGTDIIKNPEQPLNKNSGYVLQLKEVLQIRDDGDKFYFKYPNKIKIANDGGIVVFDNKQLLKFDEKGKFLMNFFKYGQGPEEVLWISNYLLLGDTIVFHDSAQSKILFFYHKTGEFIKEFKMSGAGNETSRASLLDAYNETLYFKKSNTPDTAGKSKIIDLKNGLISASFDGKQVKKEYEFSTKCLVIRAGDRFMSLSRTKFLHCPADDGLMYVSHTQTYEINLYNFKTNSIVLRFTRSYKRAAVTEETKKYAPGGNFGKISIGTGQWYNVPVAKYHPDIQALFVFNDNLWVVTSTVVDEKKVLVDVYDKTGSYIDNFFLECPDFVVPYQIRDWIKNISGNFLYAVEQDKDGQKFIKKYKIGKGNRER